MITRAEVDKLLSIRTAGPAVLSLYVSVPLNPAALRGLPVRAGELLAAANAPDEDRQTVRGLLEQHARDWLGHTVAIFTSHELGLSETMPLPCGLPERAVVAARPHVRPLLVALQRCPAYHVAVIDRRHAWVFKVAGERIETVAEAVGEAVRSPGFGGWYGLEAHRVHERVIQLARHHYRQTAAILGGAMSGEAQPLVVGGHEQSIPQFLGALPASLRDRFAGSFVADLHTLTPARARELATPLINRWVDGQEQRLVAEIRQLPPGELTATGLRACVAAINQRAVQQLIVPDDGLVPGFACGRCGTLGLAPGVCADCGLEFTPVPDLIEEMTIKTIEDGGRVDAAREPPAGLAARLRFPLIKGDEK